MLFNIQKEKKVPKNLTLVQIAESKFGDDIALMNEIRLFLTSCRQIKFNPTKTSFIAQCEILEKIPHKDRVKTVHNSVVKGYRQMAYENTDVKNQSKINRDKVNEDELTNIGF